MAEAPSSYFTKKSLSKLQSPDDMDQCIKVTNPSVWILLTACVALLAGLLSWGMLGTVTTSVSATGIRVGSAAIEGNTTQNPSESENDGDMIMCFIPEKDIANVSEGDVAQANGHTLTVSWVSSIPASPDEWSDALDSKYLERALFTEEWAYPVWLEGDVSEFQSNVPIAVSITTDQIKPISLILKNWG